MNDLAAVLPEPAAELQVSRGTIYLELRGVKMSWFRYRYPLLRGPTRWRKTLLASLDDLAAMKLSAIYDRGSRRDFVDLYALLESGFDLTSIIEPLSRKVSTRQPPTPRQGALVLRRCRA